jgi:uncharacterized protein (DUF58 family)
VIREYDQQANEIIRICLDTRGEPGEAAEAAIEVAAAAAARAYRRGRQFGLTTCTSDLEPGGGSGQFERVLDLLARVDFDPSAPPLVPPTDPMRCVLVSLSGAGRGSYGAYIVAADGSGIPSLPAAPEGTPSPDTGASEVKRRAG